MIWARLGLRLRFKMSIRVRVRDTVPLKARWGNPAAPNPALPEPEP